MVSDNVNRTATDVKNGLASALRQFEGGSLFHNAIGLFQTLGYNTERQNPLDQPTYAGLVAEYPQLAERMNADKARAADWKQVHLLFQLTEAEMNRQMGLFDAGRVDNTIIESYLFFAVELSETTYTRTQLAQITREFNRIFPMPVLVLFKTGNLLTLSIIDRRLHKRDDSRDVLEKAGLSHKNSWG